MVNDRYYPYMTGGAELFVERLSSSLINYGIRVSVLTPKYKGLGDEAQYKNAKIFRFGDYPVIEKVKFFSPPLRDILLEKKINEIVREEDIDIIHYHNMHFLSTSPFEQINHPSILTAHDYWPFCLRGSTYHRRLNYPVPLCRGTSIKCFLCNIEKREFKIQKLNPFYPYLLYKYNVKRLNNLSNIVPPSNYMKSFLEKNGVKAEKISVIRNGIDTDLFAPRNLKNRFLLFVGRHSREKGLDNLMRAFKLSDINDIKLVIAGGDKRGEIDGGRVIYTGKVPMEQLISLYSSSICTVVPSLWPENCPLVVLESMSCGTPVIGSNLGGIPELIEDGKTGFLINPYDIQDIRDKLEMVISRNDQAEMMGKQSREFALNHFTIEECVRKYIDLYKK